MKPGIVLCIGPREERDRICRWLKANGGHPERTPEWARIIVTGTKIIVTEYGMRRDWKGKRRLQMRYGPNGTRWPKTRQRTYRIRYDLKDIK